MSEWKTVRCILTTCDWEQKTTTDTQKLLRKHLQRKHKEVFGGYNNE